MYIIVTSKTYSLLSSESGLKYIIIGALSLASFLIGICIIYYKIGTLNLHEIAFLTNNLLVQNTFLVTHLNIAYIFLLISVLIKLGSVPFHI
jgi:NADH-quinone oxidoreductase subunit N